MGYDKRSLGPMHLSANRNYEPQRTNNFQVEIYNLPGAGTEQIMLALVDFSLPNITNEPLDVGHGNSVVHYAGRAQFQGMDSLSVVDWITTDMEKIIKAWHYQVYNPENDKIGWAVDYKKDGCVTEFGPDGTFFRDWTIKGCWPSGVNYGETLSHDGNEVKKITMTITYDKAWRNS